MPQNVNWWTSQSPNGALIRIFYLYVSLYGFHCDKSDDRCDDGVESSTRFARRAARSAPLPPGEQNGSEPRGREPTTPAQNLDACVALSAKTDDADSVAELPKISYRSLRLADPALPSWRNIAKFNRQQMFGTA
jgi:hypothetical protein